MLLIVNHPPFRDFPPRCHSSITRLDDTMACRPTQSPARKELGRKGPDAELQVLREHDQRHTPVQARRAAWCSTGHLNSSQWWSKAYRHGRWRGCLGASAGVYLLAFVRRCATDSDASCSRTSGHTLIASMTTIISSSIARTLTLLRYGVSALMLTRISLAYSPMLEIYLAGRREPT